MPTSRYLQSVAQTITQPQMLERIRHEQYRARIRDVVPGGDWAQQLGLGVWVRTVGRFGRS